MPNLEQIVRPFQSPGVINDKKTRVTRVKNVGKEKAIIRWGSAGDAPETRQVGLKVTVKGQDVKKAFKQTGKKTTDVRVENPDDSSQFVVVKRIDEITFQRPKPFVNNKTGQPSNIAPGNQSPAAGSQSIVASNFSDGSKGTTITKSDSSAVAQNVNGNANATETLTAGTITTAAEGRKEMETFSFNWDDVA